MRRVRLLCVVAVLAPFVFLAGDTSGVDPGPTQLPAVQLIAEDACNAKAVPGLEATLVPLSGGTSIGPVALRAVTYWKGVAMGSYALDLSAPGYAGIGVGANSPLIVTVNSQPTGLVVDSGFSETQVVSVALMPQSFPSSPCLDLQAQTLPPLAVGVQDGLFQTRLLEEYGIFYYFAHDDTPHSLLPQNPGGSSTLAPGSIAPGTYTLGVNAQGYYPLGTAPDGSLIPIAFTISPGPQQLPSGDSYDQAVNARVSLAPDQPVPTITLVDPKSGPVTGGTTVKITGTGLAGTYSVTFGTVSAQSFSVNAAGTRVTAVSPAHGGSGPVQITITTLGGSAETIFAYS
jgi:hypothetical protein